MNREAVLHTAVCDYLRLQYPQVIFNSDLSGVRLHKGLRARMARLRSNRAMPDLVIYQQAQGAAALFIELKAADICIIRKDGRLTANAHITEQAALLKKLNDAGYCATFAAGFDEARAVIDWYISNAEQPMPLQKYINQICKQ